MRRMSIAVPHGFIALFALVCAIDAQAATDPLLASGSASLSGFGYSVTSLAPASGQTPWVEFGTGTSAFPGVLESVGQGYFDAVGGGYIVPHLDVLNYSGVLPAAPLGAASKDGTASSQGTPDSLSASIQVPASALGNLHAVRNDANELGLNVSSRAIAGTFIGSDYIESMTYLPDGGMDLTLGNPAATSYDFVLSPHTSLAIHGLLSASVQVDTAAMPSNLIESATFLQSLVSMDLHFVEPLAPLQPHYDSFDGYIEDYNRVFGLTSRYVVTNWQLYSQTLSTPYTSSNQEMTTLTLVNDTDLARKGALRLYASSTLHLAAAVPEPAAGALMGLGLIGLAWARRRHN